MGQLFCMILDILSWLNGESEVVAAFIVTNEEGQTIRYMIQTFKEHNPAWEQVKVALTDKDMVERKTVTSEMPEIRLLICLFCMLNRSWPTAQVKKYIWSESTTTLTSGHRK